MKAQSNIPFSTSAMRWKGSEFAYYFSHKDNGVQPEGEEGRRYEAEFTILDELSAQSVMDALTRRQNDLEMEQKVIDNIEVEGKPAIMVKIDYPVKASTNIFPALPSIGALEKGEIYSYGNGAVMVLQDHPRTIYAPELTPALFSFYREVTEGKEWIPLEIVVLNATRTRDGKTWKCIQPHTTQIGWEPENAPALWVQVVMEDIPIWKQPTGGHDAYKKVDRMRFTDGKVYESLIDANVWSPAVYPAGWKLIA